MKKHLWVKWIMVPAVAASVLVGGVVPGFATTQVVHAESSAQTQLNQFAAHYAKHYKQLSAKSEALMQRMEAATESEFPLFLEKYEAFIDEYDAFLNDNYTYGNHFNADLKAIEASFYDALISEANMHFALFNYLIDELTEEEYEATFESEYALLASSFDDFKANLRTYQTKYQVAFTEDVYFLLDEEAPKETTPSSTHTVKKGETLYSLAKKYNMSVAELKALNNLTKDVIAVGQVLKVHKVTATNPTTPSTPKGETYTVKKGDTLNKIAKNYGVTVAALKTLNGLKNDTIYIGQILNVKKETASTPSTPKPDTTPVKTTTKVVKVQSSLNVRSTASTSGKVLGSLKNNAKVEAVSTSGDWTKIKYGNGFGYVHSKYLKEDTLANPSPSTPVSGAKTHTVKKGDTLYNLSKKYNVSVSDLKKWNGLKSDHIVLGQKLKVSK